MNIKTLSIAALCAAMAACNSGTKTEVAVTSRVELPGKVDNEAFAANIESISVMNLQMDDDWTFIDYPRIASGDNYIYFLDDRQVRLVCFNRQTGEKQSGRTVKGNGPGELLYMSTMFCNGDTLCIYDVDSRVLQYNNKLAFLGKRHEFEEEFDRYNLLPFGSDSYAMVTQLGGFEDTCASVYLLNKNFDVKSGYFHIPLKVTNHMTLGVARSYFVHNDTVRFFLPVDYHLYSLCGNEEQSYELVVPNPLTPEIMNDAMSGAVDYQVMFERDGLFGNLTESGRFISFIYNCDRNRYTSLLDKRTNSVVSIPADGGNSDNAAGILADFFNKTTIFQTDGEFIYAKVQNARMAELIEGHDDILDTRLKATQAQYRAYLDRNAVYLKGLEPEERNAANVILKIKLKD